MEANGQLQRIVVAVDSYSENAKRCIDLASSIASAAGCEIIILSVISGKDIVDTEGKIDHYKMQKAETEAQNSHKMLIKSSNRMSELNGKTKSEIIRSHDDDIAKSICDYCHSTHADMVIVGRRGLGFLKGMLIGSVSEKVVKNCQCTVTIVK